MRKWQDFVSKVKVAAIFLSIIPVFYTGTLATNKVYTRGSSKEHYLTHVTTRITCIFDGKEKEFYTQSPTIGDALRNADIKLGKYDVTEPSLDTYLQSEPVECVVYRAKPVVVYDGAKTIKGMSGYSDFRKILTHIGITHYPEDIVSNAADPVKNIVLGPEIKIIRSVPVKFSYEGGKVTRRTQAITVSEFLKEQGLEFEKSDKISPKLITKISPNMKITFVKVASKIITRTVSIAPSIRYKNDPKLAMGVTKVIDKGASGQKEVTMKVFLENGKIVRKKILKEKILKKAKTKVILRGTKPLFEGWVTWYGPGFHGKGTASGEKYNMYGITAAHKTLPFGTRVKITNTANGKSVIVRINDRGPYSYHIFDLSYGAKQKIGMTSVAYVKYEILSR